jgi:hypothetical protein
MGYPQWTCLLCPEFVKEQSMTGSENVLDTVVVQNKRHVMNMCHLPLERTQSRGGKKGGSTVQVLVDVGEVDKGRSHNVPKLICCRKLYQGRVLYQKKGRTTKPVITYQSTVTSESWVSLPGYILGMHIQEKEWTISATV